MPGTTLDDRVRSLENKIWLATGAAVVFAIWLGVTSYYSIPKAAVDALSTSAAKTSSDQIQALLVKSQDAYSRVSDLSTKNTISIGGQCYKPQKLIRCNRDRGSYFDTWQDIQCTGPWVKDGELLVLAHC